MRQHHLRRHRRRHWSRR